MIRYALACEHGHQFEGWFSASSDYDDQSASGLLECPVCATRAVTKQIMAPAVAGTKAHKAPAGDAGGQAMMVEVMSHIRRHVEDNFDYVGDTFAKEARAIHEGQSEQRGIFGEATAAEVKALAKDGIPVAPLPPEPPKKTDVN